MVKKKLLLSIYGENASFRKLNKSLIKKRLFVTAMKL